MHLGRMASDATHFLFTNLPPMLRVAPMLKGQKIVKHLARV
jgi:hypothetical protein